MKILITGASGNLGSYMASILAKKYELVLTDIRPQKNKTSNFIKADLADFKSIKKLCKDIDVILHFGASCQKDSPWEELLPNNIIGTRNVFEAAHECGCKRVVFASSINTINGYPADYELPLKAVLKPLNLYGVSKAFGEALGSYYADQKNLSVLCLRFGRIADKCDPKITMHTAARGFSPIDRVIIYEDAAQLIEKCIRAPKKVHFGIFNALSDNRNKRLDISETKAILGYKPKYDSFVIAEHNDVKENNSNKKSA